MFSKKNIYNKKLTSMRFYRFSKYFTISAKRFNGKLRNQVATSVAHGLGTSTKMKPTAIFRWKLSLKNHWSIYVSEKNYKTTQGSFEKNKKFHLLLHRKNGRAKNLAPEVPSAHSVEKLTFHLIRQNLAI